MKENKNSYCPLSIEIKGKKCCLKAFGIVECTNCRDKNRNKDDIQRREMVTGDN